MSQKNTWMYFGCNDGPGHHLHNELMHPVYNQKYRKLVNFDGTLPPFDSIAPYIASFSRLGGWGLSAIAFWDYSVDKRGGCNSVFFIDSLTITPEEMLAEAKKQFPKVFARFPQEVVFHSNVQAVS